jgi:hypothetical protein
VQTKCTACDQKEKLQKKEEEDLAEESTLEFQRKPIFEGNAEPPEDEKNIQRKCAACDEEEKVQKKKDELKNETPLEIKRKAVFEGNEPSSDEKDIQRKCATCEKEDEQKLQAKNDSNNSSTASSSIESDLNASKGSGSSLPDNTRVEMESSFGTDFSGVRIHNDSSAVKMNKSLNAQAFTHGSDIYFNSTKYDTASKSGKHLLAHELTHVIQQGNVQIGVQRQNNPQPPQTGGGAGSPARVVYIDSNIIIQVNRGNQSVANALLQMRRSGTEIRISPFQYDELVRNPLIPRTATAQRLILEEMNIRPGASPAMGQRVDVNIAGQTGSGGNIMQPRDQQLVASARADGRNVEIWSLDTPFSSNPSQVQNTYGVRVAQESQIPVSTNQRDYRVGRQLLGLDPVQITLTGQVIRNTPPGGGGTTPPPTGGGPPPPAPTPGTTSGASASTGTRVVAGAVGIIVVLNEILGGINRVRSSQQNNIDLGNAQIAFWERFGANPTRGVWDQNGRHPLPPGTPPSTSLFGSPSYPYVVNINVNNFNASLPGRIDSYQDFLYFLDAAKSLHTIEEDPLMPNSPNREERLQSRRYYAWVNVPDRNNRRVYDITDVITRVRNAALGELDAGMREQTRSLSSPQRRNIFRLRRGAETPIYRSAGGGQPIITSQQIFGPDPWVRTTGRQEDVGGWFSTDIRKLVVPANADAQRASLISGYYVKQSIEDTFDEVQEGGRPILDRQPAEGRINSFVAGPEPGRGSRFGQTRYYRHSDPDFRWTIALGELHEFWVKASDMELVTNTEVENYAQ